MTSNEENNSNGNPGLRSANTESPAATTADDQTASSNAQAGDQAQDPNQIQTQDGLAVTMTPTGPNLKFAELDLHPDLLKAIEKVGFTECTPIQSLVIPQVLRGKDVSGLAQTGTGKTAAFVVPLIDRILRWRENQTGERVPANWKKNSYVLVLVPTRELAAQVEQTILALGKDLGMRSVVVVGGSGYEDQRSALRGGVEFLVGTPGRLLDLYKSHDVDLNSVGAIVFDEADRMFDMGFKDDMKFILRRVPRERQFLLFSATLNFDVLNTAYQFGAEPVEFNVSRDQVTAEGIDHEILNVGQNEKPMFLLSVVKKYAPQQCIVFSNFKHNVRPIARFLKANGYEATDMSSLLSQAQRNKVLESFKTGKRQFLVATDVAARGLDVKGIDLVVNFDLPDDPEGYVHRIGRTGRAGTQGKAVALVSDRDVEALMRIEDYLKDKIKIGWLEDSELVKQFEPFRVEAEDRPERGHGHGGAGRGRGPRAGGPRGERGHGRGGERGARPQGQQGHGGGEQRQGRGRPGRGQGQPGERRPHPVPTSEGSNKDQAIQNQTSQAGSQNAPQSGPSSPVGSHGQTADGSFTPGAHQHRDRRLGRHGGISNAATGGSSNGTGRGERGHGRGGQREGARGERGHGHGRGGERGEQRHGRGGQGRHGQGRGGHERQARGDNRGAHHGGTPHRRPLRKEGAKEQASVGQKIKSFFSKLFK